MKNLKKVLSLVLALAMAMSLMTAAFAADASKLGDYNKVSHNEAVDVVAAVGVMVGDANGNYNPTDVLDRASAAKIISYLVLGEEQAEDLIATGKMFTDVSASNWAAKYIEFCATKGYITGNGNGQFYPNAKLTGIQFAKMLLCALGYDATYESMTGDAWEINTSILANKQSPKTFKNTDGKASAQLTRENAAEMILNALQTVTKNFKNGTTTIVNGVTVTTGGSYGDDGDTLMQVLYGQDLNKKADDTDEFNRTVVTWTYKDFNDDGDEIGSYASTPDAVLYGEVTGTDIYKALGKVKVDTVKVSDNGGAITNSSRTIDKNSDSSKFGKDSANGVSRALEVFYDEDTKTATVFAIDYTLAEVTKVNAVKYDKNGDVKTEANIEMGKETFKTTGFAKGDMVLYTKNTGAGKNAEIQSVQLADSFTGKVTAAKGGKLTINGTSYENSSAATLGSEGTYYLGIDGSIVGFEGTTTTSDTYAYIYNVTVKEDTVNADGMKEAAIYTAYAVMNDGTKASYVLSDDMVTALGLSTQTIDKFTGKVVCYEINSDGELDTATMDADLKMWNDDMTNRTSYTIGKNNAKTGAIYYSNDTEFVFINIDNTDKKVTVTTTTGYKNVAEQSVTNIAVIYDKDSMVATKAIVLGEAASMTSDATYAVLLDADATVTKDDNNKYFTYDVSIDGKDATLTVKADKSATTDSKMGALAAGDVFEYTLKGDYVDTISKQTLTSGTVADVVADYYVIGGAAMYLADDAEIYLIDIKDGVATVSAATLAEEDTVKYFLVGGTGDDKDDIAFVLVTRD